MITRRAYIRRSPLKRSWLVRKRRRHHPSSAVLLFWAWMRKQPCVVCGITGAWVQAAHVGLRGLSQKCNDWEVLPLCFEHHDRSFPHSHHVLGKRFWSFHNLDRVGLIRGFRERYFGLAGSGSAPYGGALATSSSSTFEGEGL
jgi:hypothetical protein